MNIRPTCALCDRNPCRRKGYRLDGSIKYDYKCQSCHKKRLTGNPEPALSKRENIARMQLPGYEKRLQRLMRQIGGLQSVVAEYRAISLKVKRWRERQAARKAQPFWGQQNTGDTKRPVVSPVAS
jgi:transposase-like protein